MVEISIKFPLSLKSIVIYRFAFIVAKVRNSFVFYLYHVALEITRSVSRISTSLSTNALRRWETGSQSDRMIAEKNSSAQFFARNFFPNRRSRIQEWMSLKHAD